MRGWRVVHRQCHANSLASASLSSHFFPSFTCQPPLPPALSTAQHSESCVPKIRNSCLVSIQNSVEMHLLASGISLVQSTNPGRKGTTGTVWPLGSMWGHGGLGKCSISDHYASQYVKQVYFLIRGKEWQNYRFHGKEKKSMMLKARNAETLKT